MLNGAETDEGQRKRVFGRREDDLRRSVCSGRLLVAEGRPLSMRRELIEMWAGRPRSQFSCSSAGATCCGIEGTAVVTRLSETENDANLGL